MKKLFFAMLAISITSPVLAGGEALGWDWPALLDDLSRASDPMEVVLTWTRAHDADSLREVINLQGVPQPNPERHREGCALCHTMLVTRAMAMMQGTSEEIATAMLHDVGKTVSYQIEVAPDGSKRLSVHGPRGVPLAAALMRRLGAPQDAIDRTSEMVYYHMEPHRLGRGAKPDDYKELAGRLNYVTLSMLYKLGTADRRGCIPEGHSAEQPLPDETFPQLELFREQAIGAGVFEGPPVFDGPPAP